MDETQLMRDAVSDANTFAELYRRHVTRVYRYHMIYIGNVKDAEELTARTFMTALEELHTFRGSGSPAAWLMGIAAQKRLQDARGNRRELPTDAVLYYQSSALPTEKTAMQRMEIETISHALKQISADYAEAIILYFFGSLTSAEVSQVLKKNPATVEMLIGRGIQDLRARTSLTTDGEKDQRTIDPNAEEDALVEKLSDTAGQIIPDPLFISELEQALAASHQPKTKWTLPLHLRQLASVAGWIVLLAIGVFLLNWRVTSNPSIQQAAATSRTLLVTEAVSGATSTPIPRTARATPTRIPTLEYTVQAGDTCTYIADQHGVTIDQLITFNDLNSSCDIYIDQILVIPKTTPTPSD